MFDLLTDLRGERIFLNIHNIQCIEFDPRLIPDGQDRIWIHLDNGKRIDIEFCDKILYRQALKKLAYKLGIVNMATKHDNNFPLTPEKTGS